MEEKAGVGWGYGLESNVGPLRHLSVYGHVASCSTTLPDVRCFFIYIVETEQESGRSLKLEHAWSDRCRMGQRPEMNIMHRHSSVFSGRQRH